MVGMLGNENNAGALPGSGEGLTVKDGSKSTRPEAVTMVDESDVNVEPETPGVTEEAGPGLGETLMLKLNTPVGFAVNCDAAPPFAVFVTLKLLADFQTCGDLTRVNVFSLCRNGCEGTAPDRGARLVDKVERTSASVREDSVAFIKPGKTGRTG